MSRKESVEATYRKLSPVQHVLLRPDSYIGSVQMTQESMWVLQGGRLEFRKIRYIPGLYKIFDEILVNAADNWHRDQKMAKIDVTIDEQAGTIIVMNDGKSIPVQLHREHKIYVAELIFGHLLTSSNYEDSKKKVTGGRNGFGAKLTNIFSSYFCVETADSANRKLLTIEWRDNMSKMSNPETQVYQGKDYTKVTFKPDFAKFGISGLTPQICSLFRKRVYDMAGILKCSVFLNQELVNVHSFHQYVKMYLNSPENQELLYDSAQDNKRWSVVVTKSEGQFQQVSFVNGICTSNGGTHVNYICDQIVEKLLVQLNKKVKDIQIKPFQVRAHLQVFINCLIENPAFTSQSKQTLTSNTNTFGSGYEVSDKLIKDIVKSGICENILNQVRSKENSKIERQLKKIKKSDARLVIPKLEDANEAGKSNRCTLILTEGDSAKTLAMSGIEKLGRDLYGVFPLRGKVINVRDMTAKQVMENSQLSNLVKILGLSFGKVYKSTNELRYSSVMIMADQDTDGSHIKGLLLNFFYTFWPSLCEIKGFLKQFVTPIIRCRRGNQRVDFFCAGDYETWKLDDRTDWKVKYYKGLGTSTYSQGQQYFSNLPKHEITFLFKDEKDKQCFDLAFNKKNADNRKKWLEEFDERENVDYNQKELKIQDFFNKQFRHFSISDNVRSIPSVMDGLKPSQRKILYACFKRNLRSQIKVAQLAGYVAQHSAYHHGQMSLCSTIISMAQNFVGANNLNLLQPIGQFGSRHMNGKDNASARYIFTCLSSLSRYLFPQADDHIVEYQEEENQTIEPKCYYPILPLVLINGSEGIGTGWSTNIYPHKVEDVVSMVKQRLNGEYKFINIGWEGFTGEVKLEKKGVFSVRGVYEVDGDTVTISELPVGRSIRDYKTFLEEKVKSLQNQDPDLQDIRQYHSAGGVCFAVTFMEGKQPDDSDMEKYLKLETKLQQTNMIMFNSQNKIQRYETIADIMEEFYQQRINAYSRRKRYLISKYRRESEILQAKIDFINAVMLGKFKMMDTKDSWLRQLAIDKYKKYGEFTRVQSTKILENQDTDDANKDYNYLLGMPIWNFCQEKVVELQTSFLENKKIIEFYEAASEKELWLQDIEQFYQAWRCYIQGKQVKNASSKNRAYQQTSKRTARRRQMRQIDQEQLKPTKRVKKEKKNLMQQQLLNQQIFEQLDARKSGKQDWYRYEPVKVPEPQKQADKISSLLSKYMASTPGQKAASASGDSLADRIKARALQNDQKFVSAYNLTQRNMEEGPDQVDGKKESQELEGYEWLE